MTRTARRPSLWPHAAFLASLALAAPAAAQPGSSEVDIEMWRPATDDKGTPATPSALTDEAWNPTFSAWIAYERSPLLRQKQSGDIVQEVVARRVMGEVGFALPILPGLEVGAALPVAFFQHGSVWSTGEPIATTGIGDLRASVKARLFRYKAWSVAVLPTLSLPTGDEQSYLGERTFAARGLLLTSVDLHPFFVGGYVGPHLRQPTRLGDILISHELVYGVGFKYTLPRLVPHTDFGAYIDAYGRSGVINANIDGQDGIDVFRRWFRATPLEIDVGVLTKLFDRWSLYLAAGAGVLGGYGAPLYRVMGGVQFTPLALPPDRDSDGLRDPVDGCPDDAEDRDGFEDGDGCPETDNDQDGIADEQDGCPLDAEDKDEFQDQDGCPEADNDSDGIADPNDGCPIEAEDKDGHEDADGCPEADNDSDGILDVGDRCPRDAEDKDGFEDDDGCPDPDNDTDGHPDPTDACPLDPEDTDGFDDQDGCPDPDDDQDGVLDASDRCRDHPEDQDGFKDDDGCPDPDNDKDGVLDVVDKCPLEPETINGVDDDDGCPDQGRTVVILQKDKIEIQEKVEFDFQKASLTDSGKRLLDQVAQILRGHDNILRVRVEGHTDNVGSQTFNQKLSEARAESVMRYLVDEKGIAEGRLESAGFGMDRPLVPNDTADGRAKNRRVEFIILDDADVAKEIAPEAAPPVEAPPGARPESAPPESAPLESAPPESAPTSGGP